MVPRLHLPALVGIGLLLLAWSKPAGGVGLTEAFIRLDRVKTSRPIVGMVCVKPSDPSPVEGNISIVFPSDFIISQSAANWTTATTDLPSNSTPWPFLSTGAPTVSGQTVTFASADLTNAQAQYCFSFTSPDSRTSAVAGSKKGTIQTRLTDGSPAANTDYTLSIIQDDTIRVTGVVKPNASHVQLNLSTPHAVLDVPQDVTMEFAVEYGSYATTPMNLILEVEALQGTIAGSGAPSVTILDYVYGSATPTIDGIAPVVDPVAKKIRWTIPAFPAHTINKTVRLAFRTNSNYQGSSIVRFDVAARITGPNFVTPDTIITKQYKYAPSTSTSVTTTTTTTTSSPSTTTVTPTPSPRPGTIPGSVVRMIYLPVISQDDAKIFIGTFGFFRRRSSPSRAGSEIPPDGPGD